MHFKQIEIVGFKSFADRTVVSLEKGMTAVVGPNGCGKSNILDALRWALGEQRAKVLRGAHMQDVIFNGSEERAPTGMAEVTLVFDNTDSVLPVDFSEVQITRRVYRSGESEYLINKAPCRLRDIQELFMDTGVATNAYSMIGQGDISMVLSSKPEDRRYLFEEAAGIIKYKTRKRVAMRKLDQAENNLVRLHDIILEVQRQMRSLKRQVNAAIRYRELKEQLRDLEVRAAWLEFQHLSGRTDQLRGEFTTAQDTYEKENADLTRLEADFEQINLQKLEVDRVLHARREGVHEIEGEMEKTDRQIALIRQQITFNKEQEERAATEGEQFRNHASEIAIQQAGTRERHEAIVEEAGGAQQAFDTKQAELNAAATRVQEADREVEEARGQAEQTKDDRNRAQTALETIGVSIQNVDQQLATILARQEQEQAKQETLLAEQEERTAREREKLGIAEQLQSELKALAEQQTRVDAQLHEIDQENRQLREKIMKVDARLQSLRQLRDSYEGFAAGVRAVMTARKTNDALARGIIGPIGDSVSTDTQYEAAVEAALGGQVNNVVARDSDAAKTAIAHLKQNRAGRVTFLPLDTIRPRQNNDYQSVQNRDGVMGPLVDFIRFDEDLGKAIDYAFFNTVLVNDIDTALAIARGQDRYPRMVTLEGEVVSSSGAVTGGAAKRNTSGVIGRSADIESLEVELATMQTEAERLAAKHAAADAERETLLARAKEMTETKTAIDKELQGLSVQIARASAEIENLVAAGEALRTERENLNQRREALEAQRHDVAEQAGEMETKEEQFRQTLADKQQQAHEARAAHARLADELADMRVRSAQLKQSLEEVEREISRQQHEHDVALAEAEKRVALIAELHENGDKLEEDTKEYVERGKALSESKEEARKKVVESENQRQTLLDSSDAIEKELKGVRERTREAQSVLHKIELELRHDEDQLRFFQERMSTEYHLNLADLSAEDVGTDDHDDETRERLVKETRTKLDRMGAVNLTAIDEYESLTERNDFLVGQETDLTKAREALMNVVERIDSTIKQMFLDTFNAVADNFRQYFRRLFNGGQARIFLVDENDPLESGIEIEARPPGKKPQTISLLSGGEQAMTAISLLFSLFKAKPSPFCVLDEVDAPLDDANIGRFITLVDEFAADTQFVVITHNKQTMSRSDALYGVTQQERGVSQLVSVNFADVAHTAA